MTGCCQASHYNEKGREAFYMTQVPSHIKLVVVNRIIKYVVYIVTVG